jgi:4'-phosphopantetheinyl transferase
MNASRQQNYRILHLPPLVLAPDEVHVWWLRTDGEPPDRTPFEAVLEPVEQARADRFIHPRDRRRFVVARATLRHLLAAYVNRPAASLRFAVGTYGKPVLAELGPAFNLSHTGAVVLIGIASAGRHLGVDVEQYRLIPEMAGLVENSFSISEATAWRFLPPSQRDTAFFRLWTRKEAFVKATGEGLTRPLQSFSISVNDHPAIHAPNLPHWSLHDLNIASHAAALAIDHPRPLVSCAQLEH